MKNDYTFVEDLNELERLSFSDLEGQNEYQVSRIASIVRRLLLDKNPLVTAVNKNVGLKIYYEVNDHVPPHNPPSELKGWEYVGEIATDHIDPVGRPGTIPIKVKLDKLLKRVVLEWEGYNYTVLDVIEYICNQAGAVHAANDEPDKERDKRLHALADFLSFGGMDPAVASLKAIGRVVCRGLKDLKQVIELRMAKR
jgi:hypothetical protein